MAAHAAIEALVRRDRRVAGAGLFVLCVLAWAYLVGGAGMGMSPAEMTTTALFPHSREHAMADMSMADMSMGSARSPATQALLLVAMWWVMMVAMMTPSAAPMILLHARVARHAAAAGKDTRGALHQTGAFTTGYLLSWLGFSVLAAALQWLLEANGLVSRMMMWSLSAELSATVLIGAGVYQWTPLKRACLHRCRAPAQFLSRHWRAGRLGALRLGLLHGTYCVGCCCVLMCVLFVGGVMNPIWIAALAVVVLVEKIAPAGELLSRVGGALLVAWGFATLAV